jgi:putative membrane protein
MSNTALWIAIALGTAVGCQGAGAQTPIPPSPQDFVLAASQSDQYEILAAHVAEVQGQDPRVQAFARDMIRDHARLTEDLRQAARASGLEVPGSGLSGDQAALLSSLQGLRGAEFDRTYARQQVLAHTQAAAVEESFGDAGADPKLRKAAEAALPTIKDHLKAAQQLRGDLGGS